MNGISERFRIVVGSLAGAVVVHAALVACGSGRNAMDNDAHAEPLDSGSASSGDGGTNSTCGCTVGGPITVGGTVKTVSADTDPGRLVRLSVFGVDPVTFPAKGTRIADGPLVITDLLSAAGRADLRIATDPDCQSMNDDWGVDELRPLVGTRIFLAQGETLCAANKSLVHLTGFRPY